MDISFDIRIAVGSRKKPTDTDTFSFTFEYDLEEEDLEEFAKEQGYESGLKLVEELVNEQYEGDQEELELARKRYEEGDLYLLELQFDKHTEEEFKKFMVNKYQEDVEGFVLYNLTLSSDKSLNQMKQYDF